VGLVKRIGFSNDIRLSQEDVAELMHIEFEFIDRLIRYTPEDLLKFGSELEVIRIAKPADIAALPQLMPSKDKHYALKIKEKHVTRKTVLTLVTTLHAQGFKRLGYMMDEEGSRCVIF
jgi:hypothetical protein